MATMLIFWAFTLTVCALVLFVHALLLVRKLIHRQHVSAWKMGTVVFSALVSIWSLFVAFGAFATVPNFSNIILGHGPSLSFYIYLKTNIDMATVSCQVQTVIVAAVFLIDVYLERRMFPAVQTVPQWVTMRERCPRR